MQLSGHAMIWRMHGVSEARVADPDEIELLDPVLGVQIAFICNFEKNGTFKNSKTVLF